MDATAAPFASKPDQSVARAEMPSESASKGVAPLPQGVHSTPVDAKGRILLRKDLRDALGLPFKAAVAPQMTLTLHRMSDWEALTAVARRGASWDFNAREVKRLYFSNCSDIQKCDEQGRVFIPSFMRELTRIGMDGDTDVIIQVHDDAAEVWAKRQWEIYHQDPTTYMNERIEMFQKCYLALLEARDS